VERDQTRTILTIRITGSTLTIQTELARFRSEGEEDKRWNGFNVSLLASTAHYGTQSQATGCYRRILKATRRSVPPFTLPCAPPRTHSETHSLPPTLDYSKAVENRQRLDAQKTENEGVKKVS